MGEADSSQAQPAIVVPVYNDWSSLFVILRGQRPDQMDAEGTTQSLIDRIEKLSGE